MDKTIFPQYRRYLNGAAYFRIDSLYSFEEIRKMGSRWLLHVYAVKILPDRNLVYDLLNDYQSFAAVITHEEYEEIRAEAVPE